MKKKEIILARIISTASASALALLILIAGIRSNYFSGVALKINNNTITGDGANLYNYYFYSGLHVVYRFLFVITVLALVITVLAILFRLKHCQLMCKIAAVSAFITGVFLLFARITEASVGMHKFIDGFYMGNVSGSDIVTGQFLPKFSVWAVLLVIISVVLFLLAGITAFEKIKLYKESCECDALHLFAAGLYGAVILDIVRDYVIYGMSSGLDASNVMGYHYLKEYFVAERWLLSIPLVVYVTLIIILMVALRKKTGDRTHKLVCIGVPVLLSSMSGIYYIMNPARIFGTLTLDEHVCDITESAMFMYVVSVMAAVLFMTVFIYDTYISYKHGSDMKLSFRKILILIVINAVLGISFMFIGRTVSALSGIYAGCAAADIVSTCVIALFGNKLESGNIGRSN